MSRRHVVTATVHEDPRSVEFFTTEAGQRAIAAAIEKDQKQPGIVRKKRAAAASELAA
jgi:hypothetical protein